MIETLPASVGVYIMKNSNGNAVYIGKANNIRARVKSYFNKGKGDNRLQIPHLVDLVHDIDYMVTNSERDALILENSLIKKHKPKFNVQLKDDKTFASLRLSVKDKFPKLTFSRRIKNDGAVYFGPFASGGALKQVKKLVHKLFPIRDCSDEKFKRHWQRPCLNYNLKLCLGPCAGRINEKEYRQVADQARQFLSGNKSELIKMLKKNMYSASEDMRYEDAAYYRNQISYLQKNMEVEKFISSSLIDRDVVGLYKSGHVYEFLLLHSREGQIVDKSEFRIKSYNPDRSKVLEEFIGRLYQEQRYVPKEILLPFDIENLELYEELLTEKKGKKVEIRIPQRGAKLKLVKLARNNARESFNRNNLKNNQNKQLLQELSRVLDLMKIPGTIECFDISNIQGQQTVASMVRFEDAEPRKDKYRRYRIKTVSGPNDFASMNEVLTRRIKRSDQEGWELPDLFLIDGGKGQLNIARDVLKESGLEQSIDVISIAKGRRYNELDRIYLAGRKDPVILDRDINSLYFLMRIRDEAHRFAIEYHKKLRKKNTFTSDLEKIPGVGEKRKVSLIKHFGSIDDIRNAEVEQIASLPGLNKKLAKKIKEFLL